MNSSDLAYPIEQRFERIVQQTALIAYCEQRLEQLSFKDNWVQHVHLQGDIASFRASIWFHVYMLSRIARIAALAD